MANAKVYGTKNHKLAALTQIITRIRNGTETEGQGYRLLRNLCTRFQRASFIGPRNSRGYFSRGGIGPRNASAKKRASYSTRVVKRAAEPNLFNNRKRIRT